MCRPGCLKSGSLRRGHGKPPYERSCGRDIVALGQGSCITASTPVEKLFWFIGNVRGESALSPPAPKKKLEEIVSTGSPRIGVVGLKSLQPQTFPMNHCFEVRQSGISILICPMLFWFVYPIEPLRRATGHTVPIDIGYRGQPCRYRSSMRYAPVCVPKS